MKTNIHSKSGLFAAAIGVLLLVNVPAVHAISVSETLNLNIDVAINEEKGWLHTPVAGTITSAFLTVSADGLGRLGGDEFGWLYIAGLADPGAKVKVDLLHPDNGGVAGPIDLSFFPNFGQFINDGLLVFVEAHPDGNNPNTAFNVFKSVLDVQVAPPTHRTPDAGSSLLLFGAGLTALAAAKRRIK